MSHLATFSNIAIALGALALMITIGARGSTRFSEEEYLVGGRTIGSFMLAGTMAAGLIGGGVLLVFFEYVFRYGPSALCIIAGIVVGLLFLVPIAKRFKPLADKQLFYTLPDLFSYTWGRAVGLLATLIILAWTAGFIVLQLISAGTVLSQMTGWPYYVGVIMAAATVASYLIASGYKAVISTDVAQYVAMILVLSIVCVIALFRVDVHSVWLASSGAHLDVLTAVGFFLLGALNVVVSADLWQRIYSARSAVSAQKSMVLAAILVVLAGALLLVPPYYARMHLPGQVPNQAAIATFTLLLPPWLVGLGLVGVLATIISTLDTMVFVMAISLVHDVQVRKFGYPVQSRRPYMRIVMAVVLVFGAGLSLFDRSLLDTGLALSALGLILFPAIFSLWIGRPAAPIAVGAGIVTGVVTAIALLITGTLTPEYTPAVLVTSALATGIGSLFLKPNRTATN